MELCLCELQASSFKRLAGATAPTQIQASWSGNPRIIRKSRILICPFRGQIPPGCIGILRARRYQGENTHRRALAVQKLTGKFEASYRMMIPIHPPSFEPKFHRVVLESEEIGRGLKSSQAGSACLEASQAKLRLDLTKPSQASA